NGTIPISRLTRFQLSILRWTLFFYAYHKIRGAMKREIFLYGHFGDCFSLGRNLCPDDLAKICSKKNRRYSRLFFYDLYVTVVRQWISPLTTIAARQRGTCF